MHVQNTVRMRKIFLPQISERAPTIGADRNDNNPYNMKLCLISFTMCLTLIPRIIPFIKNLLEGKVSAKTYE